MTQLTHIQVAVPSPLPQTYTYLAENTVEPGVRVKVPFGPRSVVGVVTRVGEIPDAESGKFKIRKISSVLDSEPVYGPTLLKLGEWMSWYYLHPIGEVFRTMLPVGGVASKKETYSLTESGLEARESKKDEVSAALRHLFPGKPSLSGSHLRTRLKKMQSEGTIDPHLKLQDLEKFGWITTEVTKDYRARAIGGGIDGETEPETLEADQPKKLTPSQQKIFDSIIEHGIQPDAPDKPILLHGVTGAGKTELYLQSMQAMFDKEGGQALLLVPEISLTPQMTAVFEKRFPGKVAVVHSAMLSSKRWEELEKIRSGNAKILIGPRSAVFAPFQNLKLLIVDEEHDSSYKQTTGLTYNGRDVSAVRAKMENACLILGSATPSLESFWNAQNNKYHYLHLNERVAGARLPDVKVIKGKAGNTIASNIGSESTIRQGALVSDEILDMLGTVLGRKEQAIVLVNRRGYAYYMFDLSKKEPVLCPNCSISLTLHAKSTKLHCHYCDYRTTFDAIRGEYPDNQFVAVGYGSQKAEDFLGAKFPDSSIARLDADVVLDRERLPELLGDFRKHKIDILVGTQMLAKGHDFPKVTLIVILEVDQLLSLPDFRAGERAFQLLVQAAGRAGRAELPGNVLVQCVNASHPIVLSAVEQDFHKFAETELEFRKAHRYPPYGKLVAVYFSSLEVSKLEKLMIKVSSWVDSLSSQLEDGSSVRVLGPAIPPLEIIRKRHRRTLLFSGQDYLELRKIVAHFYDDFRKLPQGVRMRLDVDPQSLI